MGSVKNEDDAGTYFKGKYRVEGVTMMWVRFRMCIGCRVRVGLRLEFAEQPPNLLGQGVRHESTGRWFRVRVRVRGKVQRGRGGGSG